MSITTALSGLNQALDRLEKAVDDTRADAEGPEARRHAEVHRLNLDRAALAARLDRAEETARRMRDANREVSQRLIGAMETIRTVLEQNR